MWESALLTEGNGNTPASTSRALTPPEVARVVATCRPRTAACAGTEGS